MLCISGRRCNGERAGHHSISGVLVSGVTFQHDFYPFAPLCDLKCLKSPFQGEAVRNQGLDVDPLGCKQGNGHRPPARETAGSENLEPQGKGKEGPGFITVISSAQATKGLLPTIFQRTRPKRTAEILLPSGPGQLSEHLQTCFSAHCAVQSSTESTYAFKWVTGTPSAPAKLTR